MLRLHLEVARHDKNQTRIHLPASADFAGRGSGNYIRRAKGLQESRLLDSGGSVECDSNFLGGYMDSAKEQKAIERLKTFVPEDGYYLAYSGGKDSDCIKSLGTTCWS